jgi:small subunit ribosomal protein S2
MADNKSKSYSVPLETFLEAGSHFGHQSKRWHPNMKPYIWQARDGVHIFDLAKTAEKLEEAAKAVKKLASEGKEIVFVGTKRQAKSIIKEEAERVGIPYINNRWLGGTITNWQQIKRSIDKLKDMQEKLEKGEYEKYTKKEVILIQREINRLKKIVGGIVNLKDVPAAIFIVDIKREDAAVKEAKMKDVEAFAIVDSNCSPEDIDYIIPANDDAVRSIKLIVSTMADAVADGKQIYEKKEGKKK